MWTFLLIFIVHSRFTTVTMSCSPGRSSGYFLNCNMTPSCGQTENYNNKENQYGGPHQAHFKVDASHWSVCNKIFVFSRIQTNIYNSCLSTKRLFLSLCHLYRLHLLTQRMRRELWTHDLSFIISNPLRNNEDQTFWINLLNSILDLS